MSALPNDPPARAPHSFTCGTLKYTAFGLAMLFVWLLWGDLVWTMLDQSIPGILPLKLKDMHSSDTVNIVLNKTVGYAIVFLFAPLVGMYSDRHRGRWGRRIPFLAWSTPFVGLFMILIGFYDSIANLIVGDGQELRILWIFHLGKTSVTLIILGILLIGYDMANIFVNCLYWYLFNDVVPEKLMARFLALFRITGTIAGALYNAYIFPKALEHFRFIFVTGGIAYVVGFVIMCLMVREGQYPPPPKVEEEEGGTPRRGLWGLLLAVWRSIMSMSKTFGKECFSHKFYWYFFLMNAFLFLSWQSGMFALLRNRDSLHLTMQQIGTMNSWTNIVSILIMFPAAWLADKIHPVRVFTVTMAICLLSPLAQCIWVFTDFGPMGPLADQFAITACGIPLSALQGLWLVPMTMQAPPSLLGLYTQFDFGPHGNLIGQYIIAMTILPIAAVNEAAGLPMYMRILPKERYGQFCSANAMFRALVILIGSFMAGAMMDALATYAHMDEWRYRYYALWVVVFQVPAIFFQILLYRNWKALGGDKGYVPPQV